MAFVAAWFAVALIDMSNYYSIFGKLKFWFAKRYMTDIDLKMIKSYIDSEDNDAKQVNQLVNENIYWHLAKKSKTMFMLMCPYCLGVRLFIAFEIVWFILYGTFNIITFLMIFIMGVAIIYFTLNFKR